MIYKLTVQEDGKVTGCAIASENDRCLGIQEIAETLSDEQRMAMRQGRLRYVDGQVTIVDRDPTLQEVPIADRRRAIIAAALPDILLAVTDGADLKTEIKKVLDAAEARRKDGDR